VLRVFDTLKTELLRDKDYQPRNEWQRRIFKFIEMFFNQEPNHLIRRRNPGAA
jgi:hypothetical protein